MKQQQKIRYITFRWIPANEIPLKVIVLCSVFFNQPLDVKPPVVEYAKDLREKYFTLPLSISVIFFLKIGRPWQPRNCWSNWSERRTGMYQLLKNGLPFKKLLTCAISNITTFLFQGRAGEPGQQGEEGPEGPKVSRASYLFFVLREIAVVNALPYFVG